MSVLIFFIVLMKLNNFSTIICIFIENLFKSPRFGKFLFKRESKIKKYFDVNIQHHL